MDNSKQIYPPRVTYDSEAAITAARRESVACLFEMVCQDNSLFPALQSVARALPDSFRPAFGVMAEWADGGLGWTHDALYARVPGDSAWLPDELYAASQRLPVGAGRSVAEEYARQATNAADALLTLQLLGAHVQRVFAGEPPALLMSETARAFSEGRFSVGQKPNPQEQEHAVELRLLDYCARDSTHVWRYSFPPLAKLMGGERLNRFIIWAARNSTGKSTAIRQEALNFAQQARGSGAEVFLFVAEHGAIDAREMMLCAMTDISYHNTLTQGLLTDPQLHAYRDANAHLSKLPLYIINNCTTLQQVFSAVREMRDPEKRAAVFVDTMDALQDVNSSPDAYRPAMYAAQMFAPQEGVLLIGARQLNKGWTDSKMVTTPFAKRPGKSDVPYAGENEARAIVILFRPASEGLELPDGSKVDPSLVSIEVAKNENGPTGRHDNSVRFLPAIPRFDWDV